MNIQKQLESKFLRISCPRCKENHMIFGKASSKIKCNKCNKKLIETQGGKIKIKAKVKRIL